MPDQYIVSNNNEFAQMSGNVCAYVDNSVDKLSTVV